MASQVFSKITKNVKYLLQMNILWKKKLKLNLISFQIYGEVEIVWTQRAEMKQIIEMPAFGNSQIVRKDWDTRRI